MSVSRGRVGARFFDGLSAEPHNATAWISGDTLWIAGTDGGVLASWPLAEVAPVGVPERDGTVTLARAGLPARLQSADPALLPALPKHRRHVSATPLSAAILGVLAVLVLALLPLPVGLLPRSSERAIGDALAPAFIAGRPICRAEAGQAALEGLATRLAQAGRLADPVVLTVIQAPEVNAFALPGNRIVVLSGLLGSVRTADELAGVLAHEMGHVLHRDPLRRLVRTLFWWAAGELSGASAAGWGGQFASLRYDRAAEARADATALALLRRAGLRADGLSGFLALTEILHGDSVPAWLTDHPATAERIRATAAPPDGAPALDAVQWRAVLSICEVRG